MSDPIANFITQIRNASKAKHRFVEVKASKMKLGLAKLLKDIGFIDGVLHKEDGPQGVIRLYLKYDRQQNGIISGLKRISKPGCRKYVAHNEIPTVLGGMGAAILSTSQGLLTGREARKRKVGGELMFFVW